MRNAFTPAHGARQRRGCTARFPTRVELFSTTYRQLRSIRYCSNWPMLHKQEYLQGIIMV
jgi:hypothetical protein